MKGSLQDPLKLRPYCAMDLRHLLLLGVGIDNSVLESEIDEPFSPTKPRQESSEDHVIPIATSSITSGKGNTSVQLFRKPLVRG